MKPKAITVSAGISAAPYAAKNVKELLEKGCVKKTGLRSAKTHTKYDATLHLDYNADGKPILRPTFD